MYVVFVEILLPQVEVEITPGYANNEITIWKRRNMISKQFNSQQTPNPAAQFPSAEPPLEEHSEEV